MATVIAQQPPPPTIVIEDAEEATGRTGTVGQIPSRRLRQSLSVGNMALLMFVQGLPPNDKRERILCEISRCHRNGRYTARLTRRSSVIVGLERGDLIDFGPEHIWGWEP